LTIKKEYQLPEPFQSPYFIDFSVYLQSQKVDYALLLKLASKIEAVLNLKNPFQDYNTFIDTLLKDYSIHTGQ
jgi:hypothetical protein